MQPDSAHGRLKKMNRHSFTVEPVLPSAARDLEEGLKAVVVVGFAAVLAVSSIGCGAEGAPRGGADKDPEATGADPGAEDPGAEDPALDPPADPVDDPVADGGDPVIDDPVEPDPEPEPDLPAPTAPPAFSEGICPGFEAGVNKFDSAGQARNVQFFWPDDSIENPPVLFVWHALGGNATMFANLFQAQKVADDYGAVVVVPESCCNPQSEWEPSVDSILFDDVLFCLDEQRGVDLRRVYTTGFSAGGLWSTWLTVNRADMLAAAVIFSGGVAAWLPYKKPAYNLPVVLVDGGPTDLYGGFVNFDQMMATLSDNLVEDGHVVIDCDHGGGHTLPAGADQWGYTFLFDHSYGDGSSPYSDGLDDTWPSWCELR